MTSGELIAMAADARKMAYAPYSGFCVGAALLGKSGKVYTGCNVENAAYTPTNCAERTAVFKAVSEGEREFSAIAIVGGKGEAMAKFCAPCGVCRQVLSEFCDESLVLVLGTPDDYKEYTFAEVFPYSFGKADLN
jgi:cytidine deaminase